MIVSDSLLLDIGDDVDSSTLQMKGADPFRTERSTSNTTVIVYWSSLSAQLREEARSVMSKIVGFGRLDSNWDSYGAVAPSAEVIEAAMNFVRKADTNLLPFYFAAPGPNGEVVVEFRRGSREASAYFNPDRSTELIMTDGDKVVLEGTVDQNYRDLLFFLNASDA